MRLINRENNFDVLRTVLETVDLGFKVLNSPFQRTSWDFNRASSTLPNQNQPETKIAVMVHPLKRGSINIGIFFTIHSQETPGKYLKLFYSQSLNFSGLPESSLFGAFLFVYFHKPASKGKHAFKLYHV